MRLGPQALQKKTRDRLPTRSISASVAAGLASLISTWRYPSAPAASKERRKRHDAFVPEEGIKAKTSGKPTELGDRQRGDGARPIRRSIKGSIVDDDKRAIGGAPQVNTVLTILPSSTQTRAYR